ncbi:hypothetical protein OH77DRAFT_1038850 [Trametes cingulata]|nr:hypothetical protein OH77DRAFT_1038850 [Trametes cingulata]
MLTVNWFQSVYCTLTLPTQATVLVCPPPPPRQSTFPNVSPLGWKGMSCRIAEAASDSIISNVLKVMHPWIADLCCFHAFESEPPRASSG